MKKVNALILLITLLVVFGQTGKAAAAAQEIGIWTAAARGNIDAIEQHLKAGTDIDAMEPQGGSTPLMVAAAFGQANVAELLIEKGANVNARSSDGGTALHGAAFFCHAEIVKLLLAKGVDIGAENVRGETALYGVTAPWSQDVEGIYGYIGGLLKMPLDMERIKAERPAMVAMLHKASIDLARSRKAAKNDGDGFRGSYFCNGEIHVNTYGMPEGRPLTAGYQDFKPSWSKTGD
ncbi:MAG: ankyrin repeat domain-containing protein, partial [Planctomycetes bacterium]|nr:ankyrin repeat domain-containing protein [Planctomycetota bacterium]